ncbi:hypothetical protein ACFX2C_046823 [Malus domestica]
MRTPLKPLAALVVNLLTHAGVENRTATASPCSSTTRGSVRQCIRILRFNQRVLLHSHFWQGNELALWLLAGSHDGEKQEELLVVRAQLQLRASPASHASPSKSV